MHGSNTTVLVTGALLGRVGRWKRRIHQIRKLSELVL
jgi:hypothetical protein